MTNDYRNSQLADANQQYAAARAKLDSATTKNVRRQAAANLEFWGNKVAFLSSVEN